MKILQFLLIDGSCPFEAWFLEQDNITSARIRKFINRLEAGNFSNVKPLGDGINELKMDFSAGYRVYFGREGTELVILLAGGTKKRQNADIKMAKLYWSEFKKLRKVEKDGTYKEF